MWEGFTIWPVFSFLKALVGEEVSAYLTLVLLEIHQADNNDSQVIRLIN